MSLEEYVDFYYLCNHQPYRYDTLPVHLYQWNKEILHYEL